MRLLFAGLLLAGLPVWSGGEEGRPLITGFSPRQLNRPDRPVGPQFFSGLLNGDGMVFIAHNYGVSSFDGARWRTWRNDLESPVLSIARDGERILAAGSGTIGYFEARDDGSFGYVSLLSLLPKDGSPYGDFWYTGLSDQGPVFRGASLMALLQADGTLKTFRSETAFHLSTVIDGRFLMFERGRGLRTLEDGELVATPHGEDFATVPLYVFLPYDESHLLLVARNGRRFLYDWQAGSQESLKADAQSEGWWQRGEVYCGAPLPDGRYVFGTLDRGIAVVDREMRVQRTLDRQRGMRENLVFNFLVEPNGDVWTLLNDGANRIGLGNDLTQFGPDQGLEGFVEGLVRHDGELYAATSGGVKRLDPVADLSRESQWRSVAGSSQQPWCFLQHEEELLLGGNSGLFRLVGNRFTPISLTFDVKTFCPDPYEAEHWYVAGALGVCSLRYRDGGWILGAPMTALPDITPGGAVIAPGELWLGSEQQRATRALFAPGSDDPVEVTRFGAEAGLPTGHSAAYRLEDGWTLATDRGFLQFDADSGRFLPDPRFRFMTGSVLRLWRRLDGSLRTQVSNRFLHAERNATGAFMPVDDLFGLLPTGGRILSYLDEGDTEWVCSDDGLFRWRQGPKPPPAPTPRMLLRAAMRMNGAESKRMAFEQEEASRFRLRDPLPSDVAGLRFLFALPDYRDTARNEYRSKVEGLEKTFGPWSNSADRELGGLRHGDYRLIVEARNVLGERAAPLEVAFQVLAPWYLTPPAGLAFLLAVILSIIGFVQWRHRKIRQQNRLLSRLVEEKTRELVRASYTDPLTGLHNRRYFEQAAREAVSAAQAVDSANEPRRKLTNAVAVFVIDLDYFKKVNDKYGHGAGDAVLVEVARRLVQATRKQDHCIRWGGEEFLILACGIDAVQADALSHRIMDLVSLKPIQMGASENFVTCSIGWTLGPWRQENEVLLELDELIAMADKALYMAKQQGRNRSVSVLADDHPQRLVRMPSWKTLETEQWPEGAVRIACRIGPKPPT